MLEKKKIPAHRRFGLGLLQILLVLTAFFLVRRCVLLIDGNRGIPEATLESSYRMGFEAGKRQAETGLFAEEPPVTAELLKLRYREGFKKGYDAAGEVPP